MKQFLGFMFIVFVCILAFNFLLDSGSKPLEVDAGNRAGIKEGNNCYCDFITGWCQGLQVSQSTNSSSC